MINIELNKSKGILNDSVLIGDHELAIENLFWRSSGLLASAIGSIMEEEAYIDDTSGANPLDK
jgi:hypothetical protein